MSKYMLSGPSRITWRVWAPVLLAWATGRQRVPQGDGRTIRSAIHPPVNVCGDEHLPASGPYVVAGNHLNGPGIWVGLAAALVAASIGDRSPSTTIRGVGVAAYRDFHVLGIPVPDGITEAVFRRFYAIYDIIRMPRTEEGAAVRSGAVRKILQAVKAGQTVILFPEGGNVEQFVMRRIQPGVGDLVKLAAKAGAPVIPAAVAPRDGSFSVEFGTPMVIDPGASRDAVEEELGRAIAAMLPEALRGPYGREL